MDDIFDAMNNTAVAAAELQLALAAEARVGQGKGSAREATFGLQQSVVNRKRRRSEDDAEHEEEINVLATKASGPAVVPSASDSRQGHGVIDAVDAAALAGKRLRPSAQVEYVRPPANASSPAVPFPQEEEEVYSDEENAGAGASAGGRRGQIARTDNSVAIQRAGTGSGSGSAGALTGFPGTVSASTGIGDALRDRPSHGLVDENRTTAPPPEMPKDRPPAKTYAFTLDDFQARAIACLERNDSVLVSAHTSAGKTVVAEYAIAMALRDKQRVIYTSPIKALSNQKYRDMYEEFADVGLMTGDVTINPLASCLVMTTEILRSMLYRGSEVMREVKWVIFDEIHYMRDKDRGVVWEESIVMLPHSVRFVFLSATIPNAKEFAAWVCKIHHQNCAVVHTNYRPTPLQHFIFPTGSDGVYLVVDEHGRFREDNFGSAMASLGNSALDDALDDVVNKGAGKKGKYKKPGGGSKGGPPDLFKIVKMIMERNYDPVIVFSFAKRECESYALQMSKLDFTTPDEKKVIEDVFTNAMDSLSEEDKALPQIESILPLLKRGIGIHHGGLLPILKEVIEILFQESLLKVLFATETFSMGINMPARTVVFTASRKFDGTDFRWVNAGEYIQMSGRAGRRGLDDRGIVIQMIDEKMEPAVAKGILMGEADPLNSAFHLGYNMLLNTLRVEGGDPERLMALSFYQFQAERKAPALQLELDEIDAQIAAVTPTLGDEALLAEYYSLVSALEAVREAVRRVITQPSAALPFLQPGRLVRVVDGPTSSGEDWGWGVVVNYVKRAADKKVIGTKSVAGAGGDSGSAFSGSMAVVVVDVLMLCSTGGAGSSSASKELACRPASVNEVASGKGEWKIVPVLLQCVAAFSAVRLYPPRDLKPLDARTGLAAKVKEVQRRFPTGLPLLDPVEDMQIAGPDFATLVVKSLALQKRLSDSPLHAAADRDTRFESYRRKLELSDLASGLRKKIAACKSLVLRDQLRRMKRVLRRLGHLSPENVVQPKGRVAAEINTADELLTTELIFTGAFNDLDAPQAAALLSCLVYTDTSKGDEGGPSLREELAGPLRQLQDAARRIAGVCNDCGLETDVEEFVVQFNPGMMELVYAWCKGARFVDIAALTKEFEGTIIRVIRRLEELTRQLGDAAKALGDEALEAKFKEASVKMRRDIIFAASLYL